MTGWFMPLMCFTLCTNSCVLVISSTQITWSAMLDIPRVCSPCVLLYLTFLSCFSFLCFATSSVVSLLSCLCTSLTGRCLSSVFSFSSTCGLVRMNGAFLSLSFTLPWNPRPEYGCNYVDTGKRLIYPRHYNKDLVHPGAKEGGLLKLRHAILTAFAKTIPKSVVYKK